MVDILDERGNIVDTKPRKDIIKGKDIYHAVYGVVITPEHELVLSKIADRQDLPNLHAGKLGCTAATIRRSGERAEEAMHRALANELHLHSRAQRLHESMVNIDNTKRLITFYTINSTKPEHHSKTDIDELHAFSAEAFKTLLERHSDTVTPPLKLFWQHYLAAN